MPAAATLALIDQWETEVRGSYDTSLTLAQRVAHAEASDALYERLCDIPDADTFCCVEFIDRLEAIRIASNG